MTSDTRYVPVLTLTDAAFYVEELQALKALEDNQGVKTIADICRDFNLDQYDFKDRWGSLLRHNSPGEVLEKIHKVRQRMGTPIHDIAREFNYTVGTVRNVLRKLLVKPESNHVRSKENQAHRLMSLNGGSLKEAKEAIGRRRKVTTKAKPTRSTEDSLSSSPSISDSEDENRPLPGLIRTLTPCNLTTETTSESLNLYEQILDLVEDLPVWLSEDMQNYLSPKGQVQVLSRLPEDPQVTCTRLGLEYTVYYRLWRSVVDTVPLLSLPAVIYITVISARLGYGYATIAQALPFSKTVIAAIMGNLRVYAYSGATSRAFDAAISLLRAEQLKSSKLAEICGVPASIMQKIALRLGRKDKLREELRVKFGEKTGNSVLWMYERGFSLGVAATALGVSVEEMKKAGAEEPF